MIIGFSIGDFRKLYHEPFIKLGEFFNQKGANAIEVGASHQETLDALTSNPSILKGFEHVSVHAADLAYDDDEASNEALLKLQSLRNKIKLNNIVIHPFKVKDFRVFDKYRDLPISIENMDSFEKFGGKVEDIKKILDKYNFGLTLDLQHCFANDNSMKLAEKFHQELGDKIVEYHLSGYDKKLNHYSLFKTKQIEIVKAVKDKEAPIIIESFFDEKGDSKKELNYIKKNLEF